LARIKLFFLFFYIVNFFLQFIYFLFYTGVSKFFYIYIYKKTFISLEHKFLCQKERERERERDCSIAPAYLVSNEEGMVRDVRRHKCPMDVCAPTTSQVREHHFPIVKSLGHNFQRHTTPPKQVWIEWIQVAPDTMENHRLSSFNNLVR
jgi:hypothetical protein